MSEEFLEIRQETLVLLTALLSSLIVSFVCVAIFKICLYHKKFADSDDSDNLKVVDEDSLKKVIIKRVQDYVNICNFEHYTKITVNVKFSNPLLELQDLQDVDEQHTIAFEDNINANCAGSTLTSTLPRAAGRYRTNNVTYDLQPFWDDSKTEFF